MLQREKVNRKPGVPPHDGPELRHVECEECVFTFLALMLHFLMRSVAGDVICVVTSDHKSKYLQLINISARFLHLHTH